MLKVNKNSQNSKKQRKNGRFEINLRYFITETHIKHISYDRTSNTLRRL